MSNPTKYLTKQNVLDAISISKLIVDENLAGKILSNKPANVANKEKYHSLVKPALEKFRFNNGMKTPNLLLKEILNEFLLNHNISDIYEVAHFPYYGQVVNRYVWAAITKKDETLKQRKYSYYPQLFIQINKSSIIFGFCYGDAVDVNADCIRLAKTSDAIKQEIIRLSNENEDIRIYSSYNESNQPSNIEIKFNNSQDIERKWTDRIHIISEIKEHEIDNNIDAKIEKTLENLLTLFLKISTVSQITPDSSSIGDQYPRVTKLLSNKNQVILYGPPGTGKTYLANQYISSRSKDIPSFQKTTFDRNFFWLSVNQKRFDPERIFTNPKGVLWNGRIKSAFEEIEEGDYCIVYSSSPHRKIIGVAECQQKIIDKNNTINIEIKGLKKFDGPEWPDIKNDAILSSSSPVRNGAQGTLFPLTENEARQILSLSGQLPEDLAIESTIEAEPIRNNEFVTFHPSFCYEDFIEGLRPVTTDDGTLTYRVEEGIFKEMSRRAFNVLVNAAEIEKPWEKDRDIPQLDPSEKERLRERASEVPFYLVIDEINRGDMSKIFGELITLIEADKRYGEKNELVTTLPYSKQRFSVPPNLYIIGTMNTADKSIALVDTALRRRFGFVEMMPDYAFLRGHLSNGDTGINDICMMAIALLERINANIIAQYDRDHQIGHSHLTALCDAPSRDEAIELLHFTWYYEILPLLQEYFYDAPRKLHDVIGDDFVTLSGDGRSFAFDEVLTGEDFIGAIGRLAQVKPSSGNDVADS